jgi:diketogulonate reductase-like aldo/keto reductase
MYGNEEEAGRAVRESGLARKDVFITTKYSGSNGLDIETSIHNSLKNVRCPSLLTANGIWHVHDDGLFLHTRARA